MSKTIKLDEQVYQELDQLREKRETFSQAVGRLISLYQAIEKVRLPSPVSPPAAP